MHGTVIKGDPSRSGDPSCLDSVQHYRDPRYSNMINDVNSSKSIKQSEVSKKRVKLSYSIEPERDQPSPWRDNPAQTKKTVFNQHNNKTQRRLIQKLNSSKGGNLSKMINKED